MSNPETVMCQAHRISHTQHQPENLPFAIRRPQRTTRHHFHTHPDGRHDRLACSMFPGPCLRIIVSAPRCIVRLSLSCSRTLVVVYSECTSSLMRACEYHKNGLGNSAADRTSNRNLGRPSKWASSSPIVNIQSTFHPISHQCIVFAFVRYHARAWDVSLD